MNQALLVTRLPQLMHSLLAINFMVDTLAAWQSYSLSSGGGDYPFTSSRSLPPISSSLSYTPTSTTLLVIHFPWVLVTFFVVPLAATTILLRKSISAQKPLTTSTSSLRSSNTPGRPRVHMCHKSETTPNRLVSAACHLVAHITLSRCMATFYLNFITHTYIFYTSSFVAVRHRHEAVFSRHGYLPHSLVSYA